LFDNAQKFKFENLLTTPTISVLHVSTPLSWRGGEQQLYYLLDTLKNEDINQVLFCPSESILAQKIKNKGFKCILYKKRSGFDLRAAFNFAQLFKHNPPALIHAHDAHAHTLCILATWFGLNVPIILHRRVDFPIKKNFFTRYKYNHKNVKRIICVSQAIQHIIQKDIQHPERAITIHSGIDTARFVPTVNPNSLHALIGADKTSKIVGNASALADHKDYPTFLKTAHLLIQQHSQINWQFVIFGSGALLSELQQLTQELGIAKQVHFLGFREDLPQLLPQLDIFLFTSNTEGLGTTLLDAIACQVPIVATNAGGISEIITNQKTGLLFTIGQTQQLADGVIEIVNNPDLKDKLIEGANAHLKNFTIATMAKRTYGVYQQVLPE
jgi:glycosyltransferase involved in cell wall biosynthesis